MTSAVITAIGSLAAGYELITVYYGDGTDLKKTELLAHQIAEAAPGAEIEVVHGGQPHYHFLISAE